MRLDPYHHVDGTAFSAPQAQITAERGQPADASRNDVGLNELDYGDVVIGVESHSRHIVTQRNPALRRRWQRPMPSRGKPATHRPTRVAFRQHRDPASGGLTPVSRLGGGSQQNGRCRWSRRCGARHAPAGDPP
jgi:hypothetical protein